MKVISQLVQTFRDRLRRGQFDLIQAELACAADHSEIQSPDLGLCESITGRVGRLPVGAAGEAKPVDGEMLPAGPVIGEAVLEAFQCICGAAGLTIVQYLPNQFKPLKPTTLLDESRISLPQV